MHTLHHLLVYISQQGDTFHVSSLGSAVDNTVTKAGLRLITTPPVSLAAVVVNKTYLDSMSETIRVTAFTDPLVCGATRLILSN